MLQADADRLAKLSLDAQTSHQAVRLQDHTTAYLKKLVNEPSAGLYEIQEHTRRAVPRVGEASRRLSKTGQAVSDTTYDIDFSIITVKSWQEIQSFQRVKRLMSASIMLLETMGKAGALQFSVANDPVNQKSPLPSRRADSAAQRSPASAKRAAKTAASSRLDSTTPVVPQPLPVEQDTPVVDDAATQPTLLDQQITQEN